MGEMPNKPDIEKLLQDYARQRRDNAGAPEMHPATRRMLHAEVRQQLGTAQASTSRPAVGWLARYWPRVTVACGLLVILTIIGMMIVSPGDKLTTNAHYAKLDETKSVADKREEPMAILPVIVPASAPAPALRELNAKSAASAATLADTAAPAEPVRRDQSSIGLRVQDSLKTPVTRNNAKTDSNDSPLGSSLVMAKGERARSSDIISNRKDAAHGVNIAASDRSLTFAESVTSGSGKAISKSSETTTFTATATKGRFKSNDGYSQANQVAGQVRASTSQLYRNIETNGNEKVFTRLPVLDEFTVEQNGSALTVVDSDGSVYEGFVHVAYPVDLEEKEQAYRGAIQPAVTSANWFSAEQRTSPRAVQAPSGGAVGDTAGLASQSIQTLNQPEVGSLPNFFRVEGTNRSLNQRVVFTGNLLQSNYANNGLSAGQNVANVQSIRQQETQMNVSTGQQAQLPSLNNFINGRVQMGTNKTSTELNAFSVGQ